VVVCSRGFCVWSGRTCSDACNRAGISHESPSTVTVKGTVDFVLLRGCSTPFPVLAEKTVRTLACVDLVLSKKGVFNLLLGPAEFIRKNRFFFVSGDQVIAVGFPITSNGRVTLVSEEVLKLKRVVNCRDSNGPTTLEGA
jgi:hypothetical protein